MCSLLQANLVLLAQGLTLLEGLDPELYARIAVPPHRAGGHMRHILEFYQCFLTGAAAGRIDYDERRRDCRLESDPAAAIAQIRELSARLASLQSDDLLLVRAEDSSSGDAWMYSSVCRELQVLRSHTIHHYALMSLTLKALGLEIDPEFGMAPSTLRYQAALCAR